MATVITTINATDLITNSRTDINNNFASLNTNKIETSVIDTDTAMAANSDAKIPSQKAVKTYIDTSGGANASTTVRGIVEEATTAEVAASTQAGGTGARLFINPGSAKSSSAGAADVGKIPTLNASGQLDGTFLVFRGLFAIGSFTRDPQAANGAVNTAHGLGVVPKRVRISVKHMSNGSNIASLADATYIGTTQVSNSIVILAGSPPTFNFSTTFRICTDSISTDYAEAVITTDATNITLTWTKNGTPSAGLATIDWEAMA